MTTVCCWPRYGCCTKSGHDGFTSSLRAQRSNLHQANAYHSEEIAASGCALLAMTLLLCVSRLVPRRALLLGLARVGAGEGDVDVIDDAVPGVVDADEEQQER